MKNFFTAVSIVLLSSGILTSCASDKTPQKDENVQAEEVVSAPNPEELKGRVDVYTTMARAVKYNVDVAKLNLRKKVSNIDSTMLPRDIIRNFMNVKTDNGSKLYDASRVLDFSITYAIINLSRNPKYVDNYLFTKSAQNLALASIKVHKDALFAKKKSKEISRMIAKNQKEVALLNKKYEDSGRLSEQDLEYKKALDVSILKLAELKKNLDISLTEYAFLIKNETKNLNFEGKRFYELDDFDTKTPLNVFEKAAVANRNDFTLGKDTPSTSFDEIFKTSVNNYPDLAHLDVNGYDVKNPLYVEKLEQKSYKISTDLVDVVFRYKNETGTEEKKFLYLKAIESLRTALFTQMEVAYNLVVLTDIDSSETTNNAKTLQKEITEVEKSYRLTSEEKMEVLKNKLKLVDLEVQESQIMAERAMAIRSMYFFAGFSPFTTSLLQEDIKKITMALKSGFNNDVTKILAQVPEQQKEAQRDENTWAKQDDWLEKLLEAKPVEKKKPALAAEKAERPVNEMGEFELYTDATFDQKKIAQLGSYREKVNANMDWTMLKVLYPELENYSPVIERSRVNGDIMFRLILRSEKGGFMELCNKLRNDKVECLLR